jgi:hypothetical protein
LLALKSAEDAVHHGEIFSPRLLGGFEDFGICIGGI